MRILAEMPLYFMTRTGTDFAEGEIASLSFGVACGQTSREPPGASHPVRSIYETNDKNKETQKRDVLIGEFEIGVWA